MLGCRGESPQTFLADLNTALAAPDGVLTAPAVALLGSIPPAQADVIIAKVIGEVPSYFETLATRLAGIAVGRSPSPGQVLDHNITILKRNRIVKAINKSLPEVVFRRPTLPISNRDRAILIAVANAYADTPKDIDAWVRFFANFVWHGGKCDVVFPDAYRDHKHRMALDACLKSLISQTQPDYDLLLETSVERASASTSPVVQQQITAGAHWLTPDELSRSQKVSLVPSPAALLLGKDAKGRDVYFSGPESLITIGPPNARKTQAHVIPNLLTFKGSAFVLDVKDELWNETAGYRQKHFGPVFRFAPDDKTGNSHRYNPFDFVSTDPDQAAIDCQIFAQQIVPENKDLKDPFWENRARDFLWANAMIVALKFPKEKRNLVSLTELFSIPMTMPSPKVNPNPPLKRLITTLRNLASSTGIVDLETTAGALEAGSQDDTQRLESVVENARRHIAIFARSSFIRDALSESDWTPEMLHTQPGTTVYFCLKAGALEAYAPLVRLIFQQHAMRLTSDFTRKPGAIPITFFLDEMPQLGNLPSLHTLLDVGRAAGVRLWLFAQYMGQIRANYGRRTEGLIMSCAVRSFMSPDNEAANFIAPTLGTTQHLFSGQRKPLAEDYELMGAAYAGKIITLIREEHPLLLDKVLAYERFPQNLRPKPPTVKRKP